MGRKVRWKACRGLESSDRLHPEDLGMKWSRCDTTISPNNRKMNVGVTCSDDVKFVMIRWSEDKFWNDWAERHEFGVSTRMSVARVRKGCAFKEIE